jgi:integrase
MLTIYKRGRIWHCRGTVAGKRIRRSLETSDRALSEQYANQIETRLLKESVLGKEATATFATACRRYFEDRPVPDGGDKMSAILAPIIKEIGAVKLRDITPVMVKGLARKLYPNAKPQSLNTLVLSPVSAVMNAAHQHGLCSPIKIKRFSAKGVRIARAIDRDWLDQFMRHAEPHVAALALFQFTTGARPNEACALRPDQLDLGAGAALSDATKNGKRRIFYLDPEMVAILRSLPPVEVKEGCHTGELRVFGYSHPQSLRRPWMRTCKTAGLDYRTRYESGRHSCLTNLIVEHGADVSTAARLANVTPQIALKHYVHAGEPAKLAHDVWQKMTQGRRSKLKIADDS